MSSYNEQHYTLADLLNHVDHNIITATECGSIMEEMLNKRFKWLLSDNDIYRIIKQTASDAYDYCKRLIDVEYQIKDIEKDWKN